MNKYKKGTRTRKEQGQEMKQDKKGTRTRNEQGQERKKTLIKMKWGGGGGKFLFDSII